MLFLIFYLGNLDNPYLNQEYILLFEKDIICSSIKIWLEDLKLEHYWINFLKEGYFSLDLIIYQAQSKYVFNNYT